MILDPGKTGKSNRFLLTLAAFALFILLAVNAFIMKSVNDAGGEPFFSNLVGSISSTLGITSAPEERLPALQGVETKLEDSSLQSSQNPQKQDKEIFYEPSIKGDILLQ